MDPVSRVQVVAAGLHLDELGPVRMPEDHELDFGVSGEQLTGMCGQAIGSLVVMRRLAPHPSGRRAHPTNQREREIGRREPEKGAESPGAGRGPEGAVGSFAAEQAVPVSDVGLPARELGVHEAVQQLDSDLVSQEAAGQSVVVSADESGPHAGLHDIGQPTEDREVAAEDDAPVLEPEVEQVSVDEQLRRPSGQRVEELEESSLAVGRNLPEVHIGDDDGGSTVHARK